MLPPATTTISPITPDAVLVARTFAPCPSPVIEILGPIEYPSPSAGTLALANAGVQVTTSVPAWKSVIVPPLPVTPLAESEVK